MNWVEYWSRPGFDQAFWKRSIEYYVAELCKAVEIGADHRVLDYGAGPGHAGPYLGPRVRELDLLEPSIELHQQSLEQNKDVTNIHCHHVEGLDAVAAFLESREYEWILMNSVSQYISQEESPPLFQALARGLSTNGRMCISDIVPPSSLLLRELMSVMRFYVDWFSFEDFVRYFFAEVGRLRMRKQLDLTTYSRASFESAMGKSFDIRWIPNPTVCRNRLCAILTPRSR